MPNSTVETSEAIPTPSNVVHGNVLTHETQEPIPGVLVVAYDIDRGRQQELVNLVGSATHDLSHGLDSSVAPSSASAGDALELPEWMNFWNSLQSDRLGSVLTDENGEFRLEFADDLFRGHGPEARPDIALLVMAPEDAMPGTFLATHPALRILHYAYSVRAGAGRTEAYAIRIRAERLDRHGVTYGGAGGVSVEGGISPQALMSAVAQRLSFDTAIDASTDFQRLLSGPRAAAAASVGKAQSVAARLARTRLSATPGRLVATRVAERATLQEEVVVDAIARFRDRNLSLHIAEALATEIETDPSRTAEILRRREPELDLVRTRSLLDACRARQACRAASGDTTDTSAPAPGTPGDDTITLPGAPGTPTDPTTPADGTTGLFTSEQAQNIILGRTLGQVEDLRVYDKDLIGKRSDALGLAKSLDALELRGGPADVTSYHDFHSLQLALKNVWEAVYDKAMRGDAAELYDRWVRVRRYLGQPEPDDTELNELESLEDLLSAVERDTSAAAGLSDRTGTLPDWNGNPGVGGFGGAVLNAMGPAGRAVQGAVTSATTPHRGGARRDGVRSASAASVAVRDERARTVVVRPGGRSAPGGSEPTVTATTPEPEHLLGRLRRLTEGMRARLREPYAFDVFAPNTFNFGLLTTYRQRWQPETYQVGELVATKPLAPGEERTFSSKQVIKTSRVEKEISNALSAHKSESSASTRADAEIVQKARSATNFQQNVQANFRMGGMMDIGSTTQFGTEQARESERRKKNMREATRSASDEYKNERSLEVTTEEEAEFEQTSSGKITNPNNEITVTYLFYELQRRYRVTEQLHRVRPVILVAQDVPAPHEIDEDWLVAHAWILKRVILDAAFRPALEYVTQTLSGDEFGVDVLEATWRRNLTVVSQISRQLDSRSAMRDQVRTRVVELLGEIQKDNTGQDVAAAIFSGGLSLLFGGGDGGPSLEATKEAADRELEFTEGELAEIESRMSQAMNALELSTEKYVKAVRSQLNRRAAIDQLRVHVKDNILYYMQAIWSHEPSDQRFFRLYDLPINWVELEEGTTGSVTRVASAAPPPAPGSGGGGDGGVGVSVAGSADLLRWLANSEGRAATRFFLNFPVRVVPTSSMRALAEVADIDNLLGFKGNYMMFPLREANPLTDFMMQEYKADDTLGVLDPDELGNLTSDEVEELLHCIEIDESISDEMRAGMRRLVCERRAFGESDGETVIVPTGQLFIEALPGAHPVLEDFKLLHRALDVKKAEAEVRRLELQNLRYADRGVHGERGDPDIEQHTIIEGIPSVSVDVGDS